MKQENLHYEGKLVSWQQRSLQREQQRPLLSDEAGGLMAVVMARLRWEGSD